MKEPMMPVIEFLECAKYDILMEGPKFMCWNRSALDRLRKKYENIPYIWMTQVITD